MGDILSAQTLLLGHVADLIDDFDTAYAALFTLLRTTSHPEYRVIADQVRGLIVDHPAPFAAAAPPLAATMETAVILRHGLLQLGRTNPTAFKQNAFAVADQLPKSSVSGAFFSATLTEFLTLVCRTLTDTDREIYLPDLARSLSNLGVRFSALGRPAEALPVTEEAVQTYRELAETYPDLYRPDLASSLSNLGVRFSELGRPAEALPVDRRSRPDLSRAGRDLPRPLPPRPRLLPDQPRRPVLGAGPPGRGAARSTEEAVAIRRELAATHPDRYRPDLASSLSNLGVMFSALGRPAEALLVTEEAVAIRRELAAANPDRYRPALASSLSNLGVRFSALGRPAEALPLGRGSCRDPPRAGRDRARPLPPRPRHLPVQPRCPVLGAGPPGRGTAGRPRKPSTLYRELAATDPDRYRPDLASSLSNLGVRFSELGRPAEALAARPRKPSQIYRELAATYPDRVPPRPRLLADQPRRHALGAGPPGRGTAGRPRKPSRSTASWPLTTPTATAPTSRAR